jgi:signal transduction histidine kinase/FixJ family two-component response regulator
MTQDAATEEHAILVVDDDPDIRELACEHIRDEHGCTPYPAKNGREALDLLSRLDKPPCLILLDVMMPGMNGQEFLDALQQDEARARIPVTLMSASAAPSVKANAGFLRKPFTVEALHRIIRANCGTKHRQQKPESSLSRLASLLREHKEPLLHEWMERARSDPKVPKASGLSDEDLRNHIPKLMDELIASLAQSAEARGPKGASAQEIGGGEAAKAHAEQRLRAGYTLAEELREFGHLRAVIVDLCGREKLTLEGEEASFVHAALDEEMTTAAVELEQASSSALRRDVAVRELFTAILGHDLRTPLSGIVLASSKLVQRQDVPDALRKDHRRIAANADRMKRLIDDLLDMTRVRAGATLPIEREPADLRVICEEILAEAQLAHPDRIIELQGPEEVRGEWDPDRLAQLVQNLLRNAIDYSPADTPIRIDVRDRGSTVEIFVHNFGPPIPPELMPEIFDPFHQGDPHGRPSKGLGLGLFIAKEIAESHGGSIRVESDQDRGTTFTVSLPRSA